jgi:agmatine deiminase
MTISLTEQTIALPPEWGPQKAIWTAWPADPGEWNGDLETPRRVVEAMVRALSEAVTVRLLANGAEAESSARVALDDVAEIVATRYGDIWLRDTGALFARGPHGPVALRFKNNGWGGKYDVSADAGLPEAMARLSGVPLRKIDFVLEGGAIDHDGEGTFLATRQTLLNPNRNGWTEADAESALQKALGARKIIWLESGLINDATDGHVDNLARFVGPGRVVCQSPLGSDDPNADTLMAIAERLEDATDALGRKLKVTRVPGTGLVLNPKNKIYPASHLNFVIANGIVVVPVYGTPGETRVLEDLQTLLPGRKVVGISSRGFVGWGIAGGGSFHCITQQEPR